MLNLLASIFVENISENVSAALKIMWQGVLAIFIVIGIIIVITLILNKITAPKKQNNDVSKE